MDKIPPLTEVIAQDKDEQRRHEDLRPQITINSQRPIECSSGHCIAVSRQLTSDSEYILVNTRSGMLVLHLICAGIKTANLTDPQYSRYVGRQLVRRLQA